MNPFSRGQSRAAAGARFVSPHLLTLLAIAFVLSGVCLAGPATLGEARLLTAVGLTSQSLRLTRLATALGSISLALMLCRGRADAGAPRLLFLISPAAILSAHESSFAPWLAFAAYVALKRRRRNVTFCALAACLLGAIVAMKLGATVVFPLTVVNWFVISAAAIIVIAFRPRGDHESLIALVVATALALVKQPLAGALLLAAIAAELVGNDFERKRFHTFDETTSKYLFFSVVGPLLLAALCVGRILTHYALMERVQAVFLIAAAAAAIGVAATIQRRAWGHAISVTLVAVATQLGSWLVLGWDRPGHRALAMAHAATDHRSKTAPIAGDALFAELTRFYLPTRPSRDRESNFRLTGQKETLLNPAASTRSSTLIDEAH